jgi:hypothetical protein
MDISQMGTTLAVNRYASQGSILMTKKILEQQEQQGQNAVGLIQGTTPQPDYGRGKLVNVYA